MKFPDNVRLVTCSECGLLSFVFKAAVPKNGELRSVWSWSRAGRTALGSASVRSVGSALDLACSLLGGLVGMDSSVSGVSDEGGSLGEGDLRAFLGPSGCGGKGGKSVDVIHARGRRRPHHRGVWLPGVVSGG